MLVIKAGGSVITRGAEKPSFDFRAAARLGAVLAGLDEPFILVHGTGSYGKPPAVRYGYLDGRVRRGSAPVPEIKAGLMELHGALLRALRSAGLKAASCPCCEIFSLKRGRPALLAKGRLLRLLSKGFTPVINSDLFPAARGEFRVVSSDAIAGELCLAFKPRLAAFFTAPPGGLLGPDGKIIPCLERAALKRFLKSCRPSPADVSGGMAGKARELIRICSAGIPALVLSGSCPSGLPRFLAGGLCPGTFLRPG